VVGAVAEDALTGMLSTIVGGMREVVVLVDKRGATVLSNTAYNHLRIDDTRVTTLSDEHGTLIPSGILPRQPASRGEAKRSL